jgi:rubrerythrin
VLRRPEYLSESDAELISILDEQIAVEEKTLEKLVKLEEESNETAVRLVFLELRLDTWKHIKFLEGMKEMLTTTPCDEWSAKVGRYAGRIKLERELESLANDEDQMVDLLERALEKIEDPIPRLFLEHLKDEEAKHNKDLLELIRLIQIAPLQSKKGQKGTDIVCETD